MPGKTKKSAAATTPAQAAEAANPSEQPNDARLQQIAAFLATSPESCLDLDDETRLALVDEQLGHSDSEDASRIARTQLQLAEMEPSSDGLDGLSDEQRLQMVQAFLDAG